MSESTEPRVQRLWLVRHGVTIWNIERRMCGQSDIPLAEEGQVQARRVARRLRAERLAVLYSSDLQRARETAEIIAGAAQKPVEIKLSPAWRELSFGDWEGLSYAQIAACYSNHLSFFTDPLHHAPINGEAFPRLLQRIQEAFTQLAHESSKLVEDGDIVLVSHAGPLRALLCWLLSMPFERQWQLRLDPGSLSALDFVPTSDDVIATASLALLNAVLYPD